MEKEAVVQMGADGTHHSGILNVIGWAERVEGAELFAFPGRRGLPGPCLWSVTGGGDHRLSPSMGPEGRVWYNFWYVLSPFCSFHSTFWTEIKGSAP